MNTKRHSFATKSRCGSATKSRCGSVVNLVLIGLLFLVLLAAGSWMYFSADTVSEMDEPLTELAFRGLFVKEVLDQGEIQSSENVEIRSTVKSRYGSRGVTVKRVVDEGVLVKAGDFLVELRSDEIKENYDKQMVEVNNAQDAVTAAQNNLKSAKVALEEYSKGLLEEARIQVNNQISLAKEELEKAEEFYEFSTKLRAKAFISATQLRADFAAVERAQRSLELAKTSEKVLESLTKVKNETELGSTVTIAESKLNAAKNNLQIEQATLAEIKEQLDACVIKCPEGASGQVVYANIFSRRGNSEFVLEEGATVREGQVLIRLPNPDKMQVRATVNESRVTSIEEEMDVKISVDALNGRELEGFVRKVNQYAEPEGWGGGGVRKYAVFIDILNPIPEIRPGMNSSVLIETERIEDALLVPIQAVYGYRGKTFCLLKRGDDWETVEVAVGSNNDTNVVIESGITAGDSVAMNPGAFKELLELPDLPEITEDEQRKSQDNGRFKKQRNRKSKKDEREKQNKSPEKTSIGKEPGNKASSKSDADRKSSDRESNTSQTTDDSRQSKTGAAAVDQKGKSTDGSA